MRKPLGPASTDDLSPSAAAADAAQAAVQASADILARLRCRAPRVHCLTNTVAQNFTANVLLAVGAVPSMTTSREEIGDFAAGADALLVNLGTFDRERAEAVAIALSGVASARKPWVLDPVLIDRAAKRAALARELLGRGPAAIRLNAAELSTLSGKRANTEMVTEFARAHSIAVALSGPTDVVADARRRAAMANGHPLMACVTAMGCAASALLAACLAVEPDAWHAGIAALLTLGVAGEIAGERAHGPGSFAVVILDELHRLEPQTLIARAKVS